MKEKTDKELVQVYFYAIPDGITFLHKGEYFKKIAKENATDSKGIEWRFEIHYGCLIPIELFKSLGIKQEDIRPFFREKRK